MVDDEWYSYNSPECNPHKAVDPDKQTDSIAPVISPITGPALMNSDLRPWSEVAYLAEQHCKEFKSPFSGLDCLIKEENSYWAMHGNFAMPEQIAADSKTICAAMTRSFRNQVLCMHNESVGYEKFGICC